MTKFLNIDLDTKLGGSTPSDVLVSSQKAIKTYVDSKLLEETTRAQDAETGLDTQVSGIEAKIPDSASSDNKLATKADLENVSVAVDGTTITKKADGKIQASAVVNQNTGVLKSWTGTLAEYNALETKSDDTIYVITDDNSEGVNVYTKSEVDNLLNNKQDTLVSGTNIKTINGETILGSGNIKIEASSSGSDYVIAYQMPTAENNYTWYRKYKSNWVEQGGCIPQGFGEIITVEFPIPMATNHNPIWISIQNVGDETVNFNSIGVGDVTTTGFSCYESNTYDKYWKTEGMAE